MANSSNIFTNISTELIISGEPEVVVDYVRHNYLVNDYFSLLCNAYAHPLGSVWWSWIDCNSSSNCFDGTNIMDKKIFRNDDPRWRNVTECSEIDDENKQNFCFDKVLSKHPNYLNSSMLNINRAKTTGVFRCSSINHYDIIKHYQTPFIVTDDNDGFFNVIQTPEEPTTNDTVVLTCRASVFFYKTVFWKSADLGLVEQKFDNSSLSVSSTIVLKNAKPENSHLYICEAISRIAGEVENKSIYLSIKSEFYFVFELF